MFSAKRFGAFISATVASAISPQLGRLDFRVAQFFAREAGGFGNCPPSAGVIVD